MPRTIAVFAALFWMAHFAMQAIGHSGLGTAGGAALAPVALAIADAVAAAAFLWMVLTVLFESDPQASDVVVRAAFSAAAGALLLALLAATDPQRSALPAIAFAALMASFAAIHAEKRAVQDAADDGELDEVRRAARLMARAAARTVAVGRIAGPERRRAERGDAA